MAFEEKWAWCFGALAIVVFGGYAIVTLGRVDASGVAEVDYASTLLGAIGVSIVLGIVLRIGLSIVSPEGAGHLDQRDKEIDRASERIGQSFLVLGGMAALGLALAEVDHFWIANSLYLGFVLSAVVASVAKVFAYRRGFQSW